MTLNEYREAHLKDLHYDYYMDYDEFFSTGELSISKIPDPKVIHMGPALNPKTTTINYANLRAGLCPVCQAIVREVPNAISDGMTTQVQCVENRDHFFIVEPKEVTTINICNSWD